MQGTPDAGMLAFEKLWWLEVTPETLKTLAEIQGNQLTSALSINVKAARNKERWHDSGSRVTANGPLKVIWRSCSPAGKGLLFSSPLSLLGSPPCPWAERTRKGWVKGRRSSRPPQGGVILASKCCWTAFKAPTASVLGLEPADNLFKRLNGSLMAGIHFNL